MKTKNKKESKLLIEDSSGNVFKDIGLSNPEERLAKAEIASQICSIIKKKKLSQVGVAKILKITQPKVSFLLSGRLSGFSLERLFRFLNALGQNVNISVNSAGSDVGQTIVKPNIAALGR